MDEQDKLERLFDYLETTKEAKLSLRAGGEVQLIAHIDASLLMLIVPARLVWY